VRFFHSRRWVNEEYKYFSMLISIIGAETREQFAEMSRLMDQCALDLSLPHGLPNS